MAVFKCKICGGSLNIEDGSSVAVCDCCGTKQTLPRLDSVKKINLYDRATISAVITITTKQWQYMKLY